MRAPRRAAGACAMALVVLTLASAACGERADARNGLDARRAVSPSVRDSGALADGDEQVTFTRRDSAGVSVVRETLTFGSDGTGTRHLVFGTDGALLAFEEVRTQTMQTTDRTPAPGTVTLAVTFDRSGAVRSSRKQVDGRDVALHDYDLSNARRHADVVRAAVWRTPPGPPPDARP